MSDNSIDYTPPPTLREMILSESSITVVMGPVGSGKSTGCLMRLVKLGMAQRRGVDGMRRTRYAIVRNTNQQLMDTTFKTFIQWFKDGIAGTWRVTDKTFVMRPSVDTIIEFMFRPLDSEADIQRLLSLELSGIWFNEAREINPKVYQAAVGRIGRYPSKAMGGCDRPVVVMDTNPPEEESWLHEIITTPPPAVQVFIQPPALIPGTRQVNPEAENLSNLTETYYPLQVDTAGSDEEYINVYLRNMFGRSNSGKPVFRMFNQSVHVARSPLTPNPLLPLVVGFDPGLTSGLTFGQYTLNGQLLVYDAIVTEDTGTERLIATKIKPLLAAKYSRFEVMFAPDPAANIRSSADENTSADKLRRAGFKVVFVDQNNQIQPRLDAVDYFLSRNTEAGAGVLLDPIGAKQLINALAGGYRYPKQIGSAEKLTPEKNIHSHIADSFQYLCRYFQHNEARSAAFGAKRFKIPRFRNPYAE